MSDCIDPSALIKEQKSCSACNKTQGIRLLLSINMSVNQELMKQKSELTFTYKDCEKEVRELKRKQENLNQYLGRTQPDPAQDQQEKKDTPNL